MDTRRFPTRAIAALIPLVLSALLLFNHLPVLQPDGGRITDSSDRSPPVDPKSARITTIETSLRSIVPPSGSQDNALNLTSLYTHSLLEQPHLLPRDVLDYGVAICNGRRNWKMITDAFAGLYNPGRDFTFADFENGWTSEEDNQFLENHWQAPLRYISTQLNDVPDNTAPAPDDVYRLQLKQDKQFVNDQGQQTPATDGNYVFLVMPTHATLYAEYLYSPRAKLFDPWRTPPPTASIQHLVPPFHRLSDANWFVWTQFEVNNPERLRFIAQDSITNHNTRRIIDLILQAHEGVRPDTAFPWPGVSFQVGLENKGKNGELEGDPEGLALLGTPNSANIVWMLIERARVLGRRALRVHIFVEWDDPLFKRCILWDMVPS
ncbi:MAG: hypothetical protein Q9184_004652 [Pyrenodesmia sp. 2 TL-2023]